MASKIPSSPADVELTLSTKIDVGSTTFSVASANDDDGVALPSAIYCFTIDNGSSNKEYLMGLLNGVNVTAVKSVSRQGVETTGAVRQHRVGSPCIITDFATIQRVAGALNGTVDLDGANPIGYDAEPSLADRKDLATVGYVLDLVTGGTVTFDNQTLAGVLAGETITAGQSVYLKESDQRWWLTDADTVATVDNVRLGIALGAGTAGVAITGGVLLEGAYTTTGLTAGSRYYLGNTAGALTTTVGTNAMIVGLALSTTRLLFSPSRFSIPTFNEKAAMAGGGAFGTPSTSNKFITETFLSGRTTRYQYDVAGSPFTWTKQAGLKYIQVELWGGGGNGSGGGTSTRTSSGGGGGYTKKIILAASLGATETVTVGGASANSTFGALATGYRGGDGIKLGSSTAYGGGGGGPLSAGTDDVGGDFNAGGSPGFPTSGYGTSNANILPAPPMRNGIEGGGGGTNSSNSGGNSLYGGGGGGGFTGAGGVSVYGGNGGAGNNSGPGVAGSVPGGGGGAGSTTGGAGGAGRVIVTEYY